MYSTSKAVVDNQINVRLIRCVEGYYCRIMYMYNMTKL